MKKLSIVFVFLFFSAVCAEPEEFKSFKASSKIIFRLSGLSSQKDGAENRSKKFRPGDKIWITLDVSGLSKNSSDEFELQSDCQLSLEGMKSILLKNDILNNNVASGGQDGVRLNFWIQTYEDFKAGRYNVQIILRDKAAKKFNKYNIGFILTN